MLNFLFTVAVILGLAAFMRTSGRDFSNRARIVTGAAFGLGLGWLNWSFLVGLILAALTAGAVAFMTNNKSV